MRVLRAMRERGPFTAAPSRTAIAGAVAALFVGVLAFGACDDEPSGEQGHGKRDSPHATGSASPSPTPSASRTVPTSPHSAWNTRPESIAAVGDSITRGFDACSLLSDCPRVSWATGTNPEVDSLAGRLLEDPATASWNLAESGALMADLPEQMAKAAAHGPELVTVLIGANDACRRSVALMTPVAEFSATFEEALRTLRREQPEAQVYVASVPDLKRLWSLGRKDPMAERIWNLGICQSMLRNPDATTPAARERRGRVYDRVVEYNAALREVCAADRLCRYDGGAVFDYRFAADELSEWDWFHPSRKGQQTLAELAYPRITAP